MASRCETEVENYLSGSHAHYLLVPYCRISYWLLFWPKPTRISLRGSIFGGPHFTVGLLYLYDSFFGAEFTVQYALYKKEKVEPNEYAEPAIYQELERLEQKRGQLIDEKRILDTLQSHTDKELEFGKRKDEK